MSLEMRELRGDDLFTMLNIAAKLDIKDELVSLWEKQVDAETEAKKKIAKLPADKKPKQLTAAQKLDREAATEKRGAQMVGTFVQKALLNLGKVKADCNMFFADLCGVSVDEIQKLNMADYTKLLFDFAKKPELKDFLSSIGSLLQ